MGGISLQEKQGLVTQGLFRLWLHFGLKLNKNKTGQRRVIAAHIVSAHGVPWSRKKSFVKGYLKHLTPLLPDDNNLNVLIVLAIKHAFRAYRELVLLTYTRFNRHCEALMQVSSK